MAKVAKPEGWQEDVEAFIREGKNFKVTNEALVEKHGERGRIGGTAYGRYKNKINPAEDRDAGLEAGKERRERQEKVTKRPTWNRQKQKAADESKLAELINKGLYNGVFPFCKSQQLKQEDVDDINLGGAIVGSVLYFFPDINLDHPLIILTTRGILFYLRFRQVCSTIKEKVTETAEAGKEILSGIKAEWKGVDKSGKN